MLENIEMRPIATKQFPYRFIGETAPYEESFVGYISQAGIDALLPQLHQVNTWRQFEGNYLTGILNGEYIPGLEVYPLTVWINLASDIEP